MFAIDHTGTWVQIPVVHIVVCVLSEDCGATELWLLCELHEEKDLSPGSRGCVAFKWQNGFKCTVQGDTHGS